MAGRSTARRPARKKASVRKRAARRPAGKPAPRARRTGARAAARPRTAAPRPRKTPARATPRARKTPARAAAPARAASGIGVLEQHMDYNSHDLVHVKRFYTEVLGFTDFAHDPKLDYLYVRTGPSSSLGFMPPLPGPPEQWRPPREPSIYLIVEDVDRAHRSLVARGVTFEQDPTEMPWGHRTAVLRDPEGRLIVLAHPRRR
jgi:predicted enzyme related to lactoylglutathione lyase